MVGTYVVRGNMSMLVVGAAVCSVVLLFPVSGRRERGAAREGVINVCVAETGQAGNANACQWEGGCAVGRMLTVACSSPGQQTLFLTVVTPDRCAAHPDPFGPQTQGQLALHNHLTSSRVVHPCMPSPTPTTLSEPSIARPQAQLTLQNRLTKLLLSYTHAALDGSYGSAGPQQLAAVFAAAAGEGAGGTCAGSSAPSADSGQEGAEGSTAVGSVGPFSTAAATAGAGAGAGAGHGAGEDKVAPAAPSGEQGAAGSAAAAGAGLGAVLPLPAVNLSFDGHSLQPIRLRDSVQGLGCLCQG